MYSYDGVNWFWMDTGVQSSLVPSVLDGTRCAAYGLRRLRSSDCLFARRALVCQTLRQGFRPVFSHAGYVHVVVTF